MPWKQLNDWGSTDIKCRRLNKSDATVLLVDHRSGRCNIVGDFSPDDFAVPEPLNKSGETE